MKKKAKKAAKKRVNSRAKGARGEREAAKYLRKLGFDCHRNGRNGYSDDDLVCPDLPRVHIEVKFGVKGLDVGTRLLERAMAQSVRANGVRKGAAAVLWKPTGRAWRLTWRESWGDLTISGDASIVFRLVAMDEGNA